MLFHYLSPFPHGSSPSQRDIEQRMKLTGSKLDEGNIKGRIRLAASDDKIAPFSNPKNKIYIYIFQST